MADNIGVIFDCDGTLVDSMGAWHDVDRTLAAEAGIEITEADADAITTMSLPEASAYLHEQCGLGNSSEEVLGMIFERMRAFYANEVEARPGALEFVRALHEQGVPMAVASSTPADMLAICVERCGFAPYMKAVVSVDDLQTSKREPAIYDHARSFLGTDRAHTWGFEDAAYALDTLRGAGYRAGAIYDNDISGTREELIERADFLLSSWEDLDSDEFLAKADA
ncbi:HAD family phosphatase [Adlercreutzia sp. R25]|uniref:HAD family phosphatase n=1 Tax=Adlercreutzia shanghongiae TaxID=3111773 RepID=A0ABU6IWD6_9ACTN|nr:MULTISPECIES: HAD family phosphatase [unclassified Adlercreutzia]MEC4273797.1 HAD family phosphatase [Adlercreutzia sp. R25]MEC4294147.1 HAD family phosphatase [Adlercreutzia sp. R22]